MNKQICVWAIGAFIMLSCVALYAADSKTNDAGGGKVKRVGMVVGIKPEMLDEYKKLHAAENAGVRDLLKKYHMNNFNIFLQKMPDGNWYEFGYYEYNGDDFDGDMAKLAKEPRNIEWLKKCDPMQMPLPGAKGWTEMESGVLEPVAQNTMRAAVLQGERELRIEERSRPQAGAGQVLLRVRRAGICGSDIHYFAHGYCGRFVPTRPFVLGHEFTATVAAVGSGVASPKVGERVVVNPASSCGHCESCRSGRGNLCPNVIMLGSASTTPPTDGAFAEYVVVPAHQCYAVPEQMSDSDAAMMEPLSVALHAIRRCGRHFRTPGAGKRWRTDRAAHDAGRSCVGCDACRSGRAERNSASAGPKAGRRSGGGSDSERLLGGRGCDERRRIRRCIRGIGCAAGGSQRIRRRTSRRHGRANRYRGQE